MLDYDATITREGDALATAAATGDPEAGVPGTDWTLADLIDHVGRLSWYWSGRVRQASGGDFYDTDPPDGVDLATWIRDGVATMQQQLAAAAPDAEIKTWAGLQPPSWLRRRMAHELSVHRWDAEAANGAPAPIDAEVAADGIDELLSEFLPRADLTNVGGTLHLHATDGDGEWFVDGHVWERAHTKADVAVRGTTADLLLVLWGRLPTDAVEVLGDRAVLDRWKAATTF
jgi:uncharacterized protein (TIGR03083 family)